MAISPGPRRRDTRTTGTGSEDPSPMGTMQEPVDTTDPRTPRTSDETDLNLNREGTHRRTGNLGTAYSARDGRSFTTTFVIAAVVLVVAFIVALYLGNSRTNVATNPVPQAPVADTSPGTAGGSNDTTGSTTTPQQQQTAPGTGDAGTSGTTAPANP